MQRVTVNILADEHDYASANLYSRGFSVFFDARNSYSALRAPSPRSSSPRLRGSPPLQLGNLVDEEVDLRLLLFAHTLKRLHLRLKRLHAVRLLLKLLRLRVKRLCSSLSMSIVQSVW